jgi:hypothetical protein
VSELSSFVSDVGSSSAEGENEVSRERFAIFHETVESITLERTIPAISGFDVSKVRFHHPSMGLVVILSVVRL